MQNHTEAGVHCEQLGWNLDGHLPGDTWQISLIIFASLQPFLGGVRHPSHAVRPGQAAKIFKVGDQVWQPRRGRLSNMA